MKTMFHVVKIQSEMSVQTTFHVQIEFSHSTLLYCNQLQFSYSEAFCKFHSSNSFYDLKKLSRIENFWKQLQPLMNSCTTDKGIYRWKMVGKKPKTYPAGSSRHLTANAITQHRISLPVSSTLCIFHLFWRHFVCRIPPLYSTHGFRAATDEQGTWSLVDN